MESILHKIKRLQEVGYYSRYEYYVLSNLPSRIVELEVRKMFDPKISWSQYRRTRDRLKRRKKENIFTRICHCLMLVQNAYIHSTCFMPYLSGCMRVKLQICTYKLNTRDLECLHFFSIQNLKLPNWRRAHCACFVSFCIMFEILNLSAVCFVWPVKFRVESRLEFVNLKNLASRQWV